MRITETVYRQSQSALRGGSRSAPDFDKLKANGTGNESGAGSGSGSGVGGAAGTGGSPGLARRKLSSATRSREKSNSAHWDADAAGAPLLFNNNNFVHSAANQQHKHEEQDMQRSPQPVPTSRV